jgi:hypothetical protein
MTPRQPERFAVRIARIVEHAKSDSAMFRIPPIATLECRMVVEAYYGGRWRTVRALAREAAWFTWNDVVGATILWVCDTVGWTIIHHIPETADYRAHTERHGRRCSGSPNCNDVRCIKRSLPKWFRAATCFYWSDL